MKLTGIQRGGHVELRVEPEDTSHAEGAKVLRLGKLLADEYGVLPSDIRSGKDFSSREPSYACVTTSLTPEELIAELNQKFPDVKFPSDIEAAIARNIAAESASEDSAD
jgi:hypothetical protein